MSPAAPQPSRRRLLGLLAVATGATLSGCAGRPAAPATGQALSADQRLAAQTATTATFLAHRPGAPASVTMTRISQDHQAHLTALGAAVTITSATGAKPFSPRGHIDEERAAAVAALDGVVSCTPGMAVLLTRIAAVRAVHADLLAQAYHLPAVGVVTASATAAEASSATATASGASAGATDPDGARLVLPAVVAAEHAAIYGYGVLTAQASGALARQARANWDLHRSRRERYAAALRSVGAEVPPARPGYALTVEGVDLAGGHPGHAAAVLEKRLLSTLIYAVAQSSGTLRSQLAADAIAAARRLNAWGVTVPALPQ